LQRLRAGGCAVRDRRVECDPLAATASGARPCETGPPWRGRSVIADRGATGVPAVACRGAPRPDAGGDPRCARRPRHPDERRCRLAVLRPARRHAQKKSLHASEQDRPDILSQRWAWFEGQLDLDPDRLVFIDENRASTDDPGDHR